MDIAAFANQWLMNVSTDLTRYIVFAVAVWLTLWVILAKPLAGRKIRAETPKPKQLLIEFGASLRSIAIFSTIGLLTFALARLGLLPGPQIAIAWGPGWAWRGSEGRVSVGRPAVTRGRRARASRRRARCRSA